MKTGIPTADIAAGMYCAQAVLAALLRRERSREGATIEVTMLEATAEWMGLPMYVQMHTGRQVARMGLSHAEIAPYTRTRRTGAHRCPERQRLAGPCPGRAWLPPPHPP